MLTNRRLIQENTARIEALTHRVARLESSVAAGLASHEERLRVLE